MNEDRKKRGLANSNLLIAMAITTLIIGSSNAMANQTASGSSYKVTEQMQIQTVTGVVVDANGEPIIGASVVEKGTTNGIVTDMDGKFSLNVKVGTTLQITFVGYQPQDVKATKSMKVVLKEDNELLDEVVVVGYGTHKPYRSSIHCRCQQDFGSPSTIRCVQSSARCSTGIDHH